MLKDIIELSVYDENGSGVSLPALVDKNEITVVMSLEDAGELAPKGARTIIVLRSMPKPLYSGASYADLREAMGA